MEYKNLVTMCNATVAGYVATHPKYTEKKDALYASFRLISLTPSGKVNFWIFATDGWAEALQRNNLKKNDYMVVHGTILPNSATYPDIRIQVREVYMPPETSLRDDQRRQNFRKEVADDEGFVDVREVEYRNARSRRMVGDLEDTEE